MGRLMTVRDSVIVDADPLTLYNLLADPGQMPRWSPENTGAEVPESGTPLTVGATFVGENRRGWARWHTRCRVTAADPGERFAFDVFQIGPRTPILKARIASWEYRLEPVEGGTKITETWTDGRRWMPDAIAHRIDKVATGGKTFAEFQRRNIAKTLANMKADLES